MRFLPEMYQAVPGAAAPSSPVNPGGASQDRVNIDYLLNPYAALNETRTNAAEANLGAGVAGSGFGSGTTAKLLDSERIERFKLGHQMLEPYLQREFQGSQAAADRQARLNEIAAQGAQALQQLQISEAGQTARLTQQERSALERQVLSGQQAMQQLQLQEAGQTGRLNTSIRGNIANTLVEAATRRPTSTSSATPGYVTNYNWADQPNFLNRPTTSPQPRPTSGGTIGNIGVNTIDNILRRYGVL